MFEFIDVEFKGILDLPELTIEGGKITSLIGESGSGKSTVLRLLNKLISPTKGKILYKGMDLGSINSVVHRRKVTMLSQKSVVFEGSIRDNLSIGLRFQELEQPTDANCNNILQRVKLEKDLDSPANILSGGEKQRLAIGRVLLLNPDVYLLDEPSSALDDATEEAIIQMIAQESASKNKTIVMVTHSKAVAEKYSHTIIEISRGRIKGRFDNGRNN
ncbi:MAG TPA: ATP-binding cassette domain-containing protein [Pseudobacteroides sp.]|uniref:ABC transporter ATP-binding protein n=1 Tax=Pseudobacteroides sp. TaxID=1968840 RepID=UPI002F9354FD